MSQLKVAVMSPDATVPNTPQEGVVRTVTLTATGNAVARETTKGTLRLEHSTQKFDRFGQIVELTRHKNPSTPTEPVMWKWRYDSLGQLIAATEPAMASRSFAYSEWGELASTEWTDTSSAPSVTKKLVQVHDALKRVSLAYQSEQNTVLPDTIYRWIYDEKGDGTPIETKYPKGRLTATLSQIGNTYLSYDPFGRAEKRAFVAPDGDTFFEDTTWHFGGMPSTVEQRLPDSAHTPERYKYTYDSADRLRTVFDGTQNEQLFTARAIDPLGRVLDAVYGEDDRVTVRARYANTGRRLQSSTDIKLSSGDAREIIFDARDAMGRALIRRETVDGTQRIITNGYDALGQLGTERVQIPGENLHFRAFNYDALGNLLELTNSDGGAAYLTPDTVDPDRLCRVDYNTPGSGPCNILHDGSGNVVQQPSRTSVRRFSYFPIGSVSTISDGSTSAKFRYDGSGQIASIAVTGMSITDARQEQRFGPFQRRQQGSVTIVVRNIPGVASRRGKNGPLIFPFADSRGTRFSASSNATTFAQDVSYLPFGEASSRGAMPGALEYTSHQWNGGDLLADLGLVHVGVRMYDPVIGRFLSRDPLLIVRTATTTHPYAFAFNDPINFSDPTGLCVEGEPCPPPSVVVIPPGGSGPIGPNPVDVDPVLVPAPTAPVPGSDLSVGRAWGAYQGRLIATYVAAIEDDSSLWGDEIKPRLWGGLKFMGGMYLFNQSAALCFGTGGVACIPGGVGMAMGGDLMWAGGVEAITGSHPPTVAGTLFGPKGEFVEEVASAVVGVVGLIRSIRNVPWFGGGSAAPATAAAATAPAAFGNLSQAAQWGLRPYRQLRAALQGTGLQAHHLLEKRFAGVLGQNANQMLSVAVSPAEHQIFTNLWRAAIPYGAGTANATRLQIENAARQIYANYPAILQALGL